MDSGSFHYSCWWSNTYISGILFLVGDFDFDRSDLIRGAEISIGCGIIIGMGQCLMSKEKPASPLNPM